MGSKLIVLLGIFLALILLISSEVSARELTKTSDSMDTSTEKAANYGQGGEYGGYPNRGYGGGYPGHDGHGGGYPGYGGGYSGNCRYGCCGGSNYGGGNCHCCNYASQIAEAETQAEP